MKAIEALDLTKVYPPSTKAVDGISFSVEEGEIFGFLGPNGAGKTTTIKMTTTLASITSGQCAVAGFDVKTQPNDVRLSIGLVPQDAAVDGDLTGLENLSLSAKLYGVKDNKAKERADELLDLVEMRDAAGRLARTYSGGMKRRLELVTGLIHTPKVLFLDEPTLGLDVQTRAAMWEYIRRICRESKTTIFLTTHYLEEADSLCDRVAIVDNGKIKVLGTPPELKSGLGGDTLELEVADSRDLTAAISGREGVTGVKKSGSVYSVKVASIERSLAGILDEIATAGAKISDMKFARSSLDSVFLSVTGRSMRDELVDKGDKFAAVARARSGRS